ncbi:MAG TPA: hypothetical protein ENH60_07420 [Pricia sp.]|nr:hypothetical protein [Pricia sp.]
MKKLKLNLERITEELRRQKISKYRLSLRLDKRHSWVYGLWTPGRNMNFTFQSVEDLALALHIDDPKDLII